VPGRIVRARWDFPTVSGASVCDIRVRFVVVYAA
jgi:hypothetical protein